QVRNKLAVGFNFMGHQQVKNIAEEVPVFFVAHDGAPPVAISASPAAPALSYARTSAPAKAPVRTYGTFASRAGAGLVDIIAAYVLALAACLGLVAALGDVVEIDDAFMPLAIEKVVATDLPATEIVAGGAVVKTTQRSMVQRNFFGLATQTVQRTRIERT